MISTALMSALLLSGALAAAQSAESTPSQRMTVTTHRDWQVLKPEPSASSEANGAGGCFATHATRLRGGEVTLATVNFYPASGAGSAENPAIMAVKVPIGASLVSGISYSFRGSATPEPLNWQFCNRNTCLATAAVSNAGIERMKNARDILLGYRPLPGSRPLVVPVSLLGFTKAWAGVTACANQQP